MQQRFHTMRSCLLLCTAAVCFGSSSNSLAFGLRPEATTNEGQIRRLEQSSFGSWLDEVADTVVRHFSDPVHENITHRIYGCTLTGKGCADSRDASTTAPAAVIAGVRWNDNPPFSIDNDLKNLFPNCRGDYTAFKLPSFSKCWIDLFKDAERNAGQRFYRARANGQQYALIYRVHFGDMQFLHSMASWNGELAHQTRARILMWAEFTYRFANGEFEHNQELRRIPITGMDKVFQGVNWSAERLFTLDDTTFRTPEMIRQMALGSVLHMIQDSFSLAHVKREGDNGDYCPGTAKHLKPGRIEAFHAYNSQKSSEHGKKDTHDGFEVHVRSKTPTVVTVGQTVLAFLKTKAPWKEASPYFECIYDVVDADEPASPGDYAK